MEVKIFDFGYEKMPVRKHKNDVGIDVHATEDVVLHPHETYVMGLGFGVEVPVGMAGFIVPRSSMAAAGVLPALTPIDPFYKNEIHAVLQFSPPNGKDGNYSIKKGDRIAQLIFVPAFTPELVPENKADESRGMGGFGSTGK